ncbi:hypothetical protein [Cryptosporangium sp. NPDC051539]
MVRTVRTSASVAPVREPTTSAAPPDIRVTRTRVCSSPAGTRLSPDR